MKLIKVLSSLPDQLRSIFMDLMDNREFPVMEGDEMTTEEIERMYTDIGGEG